jgi:hypothetical protein
MRRMLVFPALALLAACQPQHPPNAAAPAAPQGSIALPAGDAAHRYDNAIRPAEESRTAVAPTAPRAAPLPRLSERERLAIVAWEKEDAAANGSTLTVAPPSRTRTKLALPGDGEALPKPAAERTSSAAPAARELAVPPSAGERPDVPARAASATAPPPPAPEAPPPPAQSVQPAAPTPAPAPPPAPSPPAARPAPPAAAAPAAAVERAIQPPPGPPLTTVLFAPRSANLSDEARIALSVFAQDPRARRLRRIELWACSSAEDPLDAGKIALARALSVHAFLIDLGLKANIEIAGYSEALAGGSPDRVDVMVR